MKNAILFALLITGVIAGNAQIKKSDSIKASSPFISGSHNWSLADLQQQGLRFLVAYLPNIALDACERKQVTVKLAIEKADGTPHPTLNNKTIVFNITPLLGVPTGMALVCEADKILCQL